jgi:hypothetical protein
LGKGERLEGTERVGKMGRKGEDLKDEKNEGGKIPYSVAS